MLLAVALPLAAVFLASAKSPRERAAVGVLLLFFLGSIVASASRAALAAGCGALLVLGVLGLDRPRSRVAAAAAVVLVFAISVLITQIPQARREQSSSPPRAAGLTSAVGRSRLLNAELYRRLEDDVGHPPYGSNEVHIRRTLFGSSGRAQAWDGALQQALDRPVAGYGFGTEQHVFVDRYISFEGGVPENSYLGLLLQLGFAGLAAFLVIPAVLFVGLRASLPRLDNEARTLAAACAAVVAGALVIAFAQSYVYSVGNVATASVWICAFLLPAVAVRRV
jgi:O-antigen ligase